MKLLLRRDQKTGLMGKSKYTLYVRAQLTDAEANLVRKNRLENELLLYFDKDAHSSGYFRQKKDEGGFMGLAASLSAMYPSPWGNSSKALPLPATTWGNS